jgi:hypothetical protein
MKYLYTISLCLIFVFLVNFNITNAQTGSNLVPAQNSLSKTKCPDKCPQGQQCIKRADDFLDCRETVTNCTPACTGSKVCVKAKPTDPKGTCVDDAPASAKTQTLTPSPTKGGNPTVGNGDDTVSTPTNNPNSLKDGLQAFGSAGSGINTTGTLIGFIANIIRWILGLLGTVFFIIIVMQGYIYMTAGGDSGKTASAVGAIGNAVVGLLIIMGAFLITNFVTSALLAS